MTPFPTTNVNPCGRRSFDIAIAVWGAKFSEQLLEIALPAMLSPNNLPAIAGEDVRLLILCPILERETHKAHPVFKQIEKYCVIRFIEITPSNFRNSHAVLSAAHQVALGEAIERKAFCILLNADSIVADGSLKALVKLGLDGKRVVLVSGLRLNELTATPVLKMAIADSKLAPRELLKLALDHLHPEMTRSIVGSENFTPIPTLCLWSLSSQGLLQRAFHLHPILIDCAELTSKSLDSLESDTIDGALILMAFPDPEDVYVCRDSDELLAFSLSHPAEHVEPDSTVFSVELLRRTAVRQNVNVLHRLIFTRPIRLHTGDCGPEWRALERETALISLKAIDTNESSTRDSIAAARPVELLKHGIARIYSSPSSNWVVRRSFRLIYRLLDIIDRARLRARH